MLFAAREALGMAKKRKLFMAHAGELAHRLVRSVRPDALVAELAKSYASKNKRHGVVDSPARIRELEQTIGREAIMVMLTEIRRLLPAALGAANRPDGEASVFAAMFQDEFEKALLRALDWPAAEAAAEQEAFLRDLEMYQRHFSANGEKRDRVSPFYDRCALLLDPSMMEAARRAAAGFQAQLQRRAARILGQLGSALERKRQPTRRKGTGRAKTAPKANRTAPRHHSRHRKK